MLAEQPHKESPFKIENAYLGELSRSELEIEHLPKFCECRQPGYFLLQHSIDKSKRI
jgi:hypothetical protein